MSYFLLQEEKVKKQKQKQKSNTKTGTLFTSDVTEDSLHFCSVLFCSVLFSSSVFPNYKDKRFETLLQ